MPPRGQDPLPARRLAHSGFVWQAMHPRSSSAGLLLVVLLLLGAGAATARTLSPGASAPVEGLGPLRPWGGTLIRSLDPAGGGTAVPRTASESSEPTTTSRSDQVLSNETTSTRWAYVDRIQAIYKRPTTSSARITRLHWYTEDGFPEIYLLLRAHWDAHGQEWVEVRIPMRPNGKTGWVRRGALGAFHLTHLLVVVNRERLRMYFYSQGRLRWSAPVGVGAPSTPTPAGHFWIRERFQIADPQSGYWPYAFGTSDYSTLTDWPGGGVVGIHGPYYASQLIPGHISHGCIRLRVPDDFWLAAHIRLGTPVRVV